MRDLVETVIDGILSRERSQSRPAGGDRFRQTLEQVRSQPPRHDIQGTRPGLHAAEHRNEKLWQASLQFEAQFIQQMMAAMRKSVPKSGLLPHGFAQDVQNSMMDMAIADAASKRGDLGIAESIYRQMTAGQAEEAAQELPEHTDIANMEHATGALPAAITEAERYAR